MSRAEGIAWLSWGPEVFERAKREQKPILLSVVACWSPWCRVMDRESFTLPEVVSLVRERTVALRVDRDLRPDIDRRYQISLGALAGQSGWPLAAVLTPAGEMFQGGTFLGPEVIVPFLQRALTLWHENLPEVQSQARRGTQALLRQVRQARGETGVAPLSLDGIVRKVLEEIEGQFDFRHGGFRYDEGPKFPASAAIDFLLDRLRELGDPKARLMVEKTLSEIARSPLRDEAAGGFFRHAKYRDWKEPEPQKMLSENALLLRNFVEGFSVLGREDLLDAAKGILRFLENRLYDSEKNLFRAGEYSMGDEGGAGGEGSEPYTERWESPFFVEANALVASALFAASRAVPDSPFGDLANRILERLWTEGYRQGGMLHTIPAMEPCEPFLLADQVFMARALIDGHHATGSRPYLERARELISWTLAEFSAPEGYLLDRRPSVEPLSVLSIPQAILEDQAVPSANAVAAILLGELLVLTGDPSLRERAGRILDPFASEVASFAYGYYAATFALACDRFHRSRQAATLGSRRT